MEELKALEEELRMACGCRAHPATKGKPCDELECRTADALRSIRERVGPMLLTEDDVDTVLTVQEHVAKVGYFHRGLDLLCKRFRAMKEQP
jgi:hypothetical protein